MSEEVLRVLLKDLETVRVRCMECDSVVEVSIQKLSMIFGRQVCPCCQSQFYDRDKERERGQIGNPFEKLAEALDLFAEVKGKMAVEFQVAKPSQG
jgi:hypothetical protein